LVELESCLVTMTLQCVGLVEKKFQYFASFRPPLYVLTGIYLVDPASSHMLVSKIKPCMSKYKPKHGETANGSLNQLRFLRSYNPTWITVVILELIHAPKL
jgi:hypothetical protein